MYIFIFYIIILGIIKAFLLNNSSYQKLFVLFAGLLLFLLSAFRSIHFGPDAKGYVKNYEELENVNLKELFMNAIFNEGKDPFFYFVSKLINMLGMTPYMWLAVIAFIFSSSIIYLIYKYSDESYLSYIMIITLGYLFFSYTGLRQTIALSIIILSYKYLVEKKMYKFIFIVILASLFHSSAILFLLAYVVKDIKIGWKQLLIVALSLFITYFYNTPVLKVVELLKQSNDRYDFYAGNAVTLTISGFLIQLSIYLFALFYKNNLIKNNSDNTLLYNLLVLGLVFQAFSGIIAESFRISMYFSVFSIILIPKVIKSEPNKWLRSIIYLGVWSMLLIYFIRTGDFEEFKFYWQ